MFLNSKMLSNSITPRKLVKQFSIGFIPLFIFIIADELFGTEIGLLTAIIAGITEIGIYYLREKRIETFVLFDIGLIIALGSISIILDDDIFFKLKPALIELILLILIGIHAFSTKPLLLLLGKRYLKDIQVNDLQLQLMKKMSRLLFFIILFHILLIVYSAFYLSNESWAFISGGLFYILFGAVLFGQWVYFRFKRSVNPVNHESSDEEWFDLVSEKGEIVGKAPRSAVHGNPNLIHPVVHLHIFNSSGHLYLQKRAMSKDVQPGKWDTAVGGHIHSGEEVITALKREALEELGINDVIFQPLYSYIMRNNFESEFVHTFRMTSNGPFKINHDEILFGKFWRIRDIRNNIGKNIFTPNFEQEFTLLQQILKNKH